MLFPQVEAIADVPSHVSSTVVGTALEQAGTSGHEGRTQVEHGAEQEGTLGFRAWPALSRMVMCDA
jgi:hypothetical protein